MPPTSPDNPPPKPAAPARRPALSTGDAVTIAPRSSKVPVILDTTQKALDVVRRRQGKAPVTIGPKLPLLPGHEAPAPVEERGVEYEPEWQPEARARRLATDESAIDTWGVTVEEWRVAA